MAKQILKYVLILFTIAISFFSWGSVDKAINSSASGEWMVPIVLFSLFFILLYLVAILVKERYVLQLLPLFCFLLSFLFVFNFWHFVAVLLGFALAFVGMHKVKRDLDLNIKINLGKTINTGKQFIIIAVALIVSSQYFFTIKNKDFQYIVPQIQSSKFMDSMTSKILGVINPDFKNISDKEITVDDFIIETQKKQMENENIQSSVDEQISKTIEEEGGSLTSLQKEALKKDTGSKLEGMNNKILENNSQVLLMESRKSLSQLVGKELSGQEKVSEIFPQMINKKITDYFKPKMANNKALPLLPMILAIILFLTIVPVGSILNIFWTLITRLIFWILVKAKVVTILKIQKEVEIIE